MALSSSIDGSTSKGHLVHTDYICCHGYPAASDPEPGPCGEEHRTAGGVYRGRLEWHHCLVEYSTRTHLYDNEVMISCQHHSQENN